MKFAQSIICGLLGLVAPALAQSSFGQQAAQQNQLQDAFGHSMSNIPFEDETGLGQQGGEDMFGGMMTQENAFTKNLDQIMFKGMAVFEDCQVNPMSMVAQFDQVQDMGISDGTDAAKQLLDSLHHLGDECSPDQATTFTAGLDDFKTCAGFDLREFLETLPSALIGTVWECLVTEDFSGIHFNDPTSVTHIKVSPSCLNFQYGANPFGDASRAMVLKPDVVMKCLGQLSPKIPLCSISQWPIPLVGKVLKPASCIISKLQPITDLVIASELEVWESCLPKEGSLCTNTCLDDGSLLIGTANGVPVPDAISRVATNTNNGKYTSAVKRYMKYTSECTQMWEGFENPEAMEEHNSNVVSMAALAGQGSAAGGAGIGFGTFVAGLVFGAILFKVVMVVQEKRMRARMADIHYTGVPASPMV